jgi:hypothetical protein
VSIRLENDIRALEVRIAELEMHLAEVLALLRAMTRASTQPPPSPPRGKAA